MDEIQDSFVVIELESHKHVGQVLFLSSVFLQNAC